MPLTLDRAKPAVPFGGNYRLIDFVLSNLTNGAQQYAAVWGYTDPATNREFAIVGAYNGTWIVETTNPSNPVTITTIAAHME